jgi:hypothetical protein
MLVDCFGTGHRPLCPDSDAVCARGALTTGGAQGLLYDLFYAGLDCKKFTKDLEKGGIFEKYKGTNPCKDKKADFKFDGIETLLQSEFGVYSTSAPYALRCTPCTQHPSPYAHNPQPYTLDPTPYTLHETL